MKNKRILFTKENTAEYLECEEIPEVLEDDEVLVKTLVSTISPGTERANITGNNSVAAANKDKTVVWPRQMGYSTCGIVEKIGAGVTTVKPGDRVIAFWGKHNTYNLQKEKHVYNLEGWSIPTEDAAAIFIATFPMAAIRKCHLEIGESALVMGCGLLGQFAIRLLKCAGATPIVAVDMIASRREEALKSGADYVFDPTDPDFEQKVRSVTNGGISVCIEVTGVGAGLDEALDCMNRFGRVALLGCTRDPNFTIDYYRKIHAPGITIVGAHTAARPQFESSPGLFTDHDDITALLKLVEFKRLSISDMLGLTFKPKECPDVYNHIIFDRSFPTLAQFDWRGENA